MLNGQKVKISTNSFDAIPMDRYTVQIKDVNLIQAAKYQSTEMEDVLNYQFVILDDKKYMDSEKEEVSTRGRFLWARCRLSLGSQSTWGKLVVAVIGRELTKDEKANFDPESIVGKQVDVMVSQNPSKDGTRIFNNIVAFSKNLKPLPPFEDGVAQKEPVVKTTKTVVVPTVAPDDADPEKFISNLEKENEDADSSEDTEETPEELELKLKLAQAKAKAAKAKAKAKK